MANRFLSQAKGALLGNPEEVRVRLASERRDEADPKPTYTAIQETLQCCGKALEEFEWGHHTAERH